jgi:hypothetical protein
LERRQLVGRHLAGTQGLSNEPSFDELVGSTREQVEAMPGRPSRSLTEASGTGVEIALHQEGPPIAHEIQRERLSVKGDIFEPQS